MPSGVLSVIKSSKESDFEWQIDNFSLNKEWYLSPTFTFEGELWDFELFPNRSNGYIEMFFWKTSDGFLTDVEFSVAFKTTKGTKSFERHYRYSFTRCIECRIEQWISRKDFSNRRSEFLLSGCFTILLTMKRTKYGEAETIKSAALCSLCEDTLHGDTIAFHQKCIADIEEKCPRCDKVVSLQNWFDHVCQMADLPAPANTSDSSTVKDDDKIIQGMRQLLLNQEHSDVVLRVKGKEFPAHKAILSVRSAVFASTFRHEMKENKTGIVDIEDCDPSFFPDFLRFLYCNDTGNLSAENVFSLFTISDKYDCQDLRVKCVCFLKENLTVETFCKALALALLHNEAELLLAATDFFIKNAEIILETVEWQTFAVENPLYSNEIFIKYVKSIKQSNN